MTESKNAKPRIPMLHFESLNHLIMHLAADDYYDEISGERATDPDVSRPAHPRPNLVVVKGEPAPLDLNKIRRPLCRLPVASALYLKSPDASEYLGQVCSLSQSSMKLLLRARTRRIVPASRREWASLQKDLPAIVNSELIWLVKSGKAKGPHRKHFNVDENDVLLGVSSALRIIPDQDLLV